MNTLTLNGRPCSVEPGESLYDCVCRHLGRDEIPVLCHDPALEVFGACRLCLVEVARTAEGPDRLMAACHTPASDGLHVSTRSERLHRVRRGVLELLASNFPETQLTPVEGELPTLFQRLLAEYGVTSSRYPRHREAGEPAKPHPYLRFDPSE